jgi:hypothetical protein
METGRGTAGLAQAAASNAQAKRRGRPTFCRSMLACYSYRFFLLTIWLTGTQAVEQIGRTAEGLRPVPNQVLQSAGKRRQYRNRFSHS